MAWYNLMLVCSEPGEEVLVYFSPLTLVIVFVCGALMATGVRMLWR